MHEIICSLNNEYIEINDNIGFMNGSNFKRRRFWYIYLEQESSKCLQAVVIFRMKCQLLFLLERSDR